MFSFTLKATAATETAAAAATANRVGATGRGTLHDADASDDDEFERGRAEQSGACRYYSRNGYYRNGSNCIYLHEFDDSNAGRRPKARWR